MSMNFRLFLQQIIERKGATMSEIADASGVALSEISKIVAGKRNPGFKVASQIFRGLNEKDQGKAVVAWLKDQVPADMMRKVEICEARTVFREEPDDPKTLEGALAILGRRASANESVRTILTQMALTLG